MTGPGLVLVHDWSLIQGHGDFRSWWKVAQYTVWSLCVVMFSPFFNDDLCFSKALEELSVEQFIS